MTVCILTKDGEKFNMQIKYLAGSKFLFGMIEDLAGIPDDPDNPDKNNLIPLPNIDSDTWKRISEYLKYHYDIQSPKLEVPILGGLQNSVCSWDFKFINVEIPILVKLIQAANYLDIRDLLKLTTAQFANRLQSRGEELVNAQSINDGEVKKEETWINN
jgi:hypothetical protein